MTVNSELLTPEQVRSARFSSARFGRRGLDEAEVNGFREWVAEGIGHLLNENHLLHAEIARLRERLLEGKGKGGIQAEDGHVQAVYVLSQAQQTADRYVADAQEYSRELAEEARLRRDEIMREAKVRASMILEEAHSSASKAAEAIRSAGDPHADAERQDLQTEIAYLRTFSDVCRTHLRAYLEALSRSIEEWERTEHSAARTVMESVRESARESGRESGRESAREPGRDSVLHTTP